MKILIQNGATDNVGDLSMLEGASGLLSDQFPEINLYIECSATLPNSISELRNATVIEKINLKWLKRVRESKLGEKKKKLLKIIVYGSYIIRILWGRRVLKTIIETNGICYSLKEYCSEFSVLLLCGGGYLNDVFIHELINKMYFMRAFKLLDKPYLLTGQQIGPFSSSLLKRLLKRILMSSRYIALREPLESPSLFEDDSRFDGLYEVVGDDSFGVNSAKDFTFTFEISELLEKHDFYIAVNFRYSGYAINKVDYLDKFGKILLKFQEEKKYPYIFIPISVNSGDSDVVSGDLLKRRFPGLDLFVLRDQKQLNTSSIKKVLQKAYGSIGVSYHFCTFTLSVGTPSVCIYDGQYYRQKAMGLCSIWGNTHIAASIKESSEDAIVAQIKEVFCDDSYRKKVVDMAMANRIQWHTTLVERFSEVFDNVESKKC